MLKPQWCLDRAKRMRHLIVPSADTQYWLDTIKSNGWIESGLGILSLDDGMKAIPLSKTAPEEGDSYWQNLPLIELRREDKSAKHWTDLLDRELYDSLEEHWPRAYEIIGDVLIVKLEEEVYSHKKTIAEAMLEQIPNVRIVCADNGVEGEFRVRNLSPILSRDGSNETLTTIRENGQRILIDPTKSYFSSRLSTERQGNLAAAKQLSETVGRKITVCDPYAGVGPSMAGLLNNHELFDSVLVGDLNPQAVELLTKNIEHYLARGNSQINATILCQDARLWKDDPKFIDAVDFLLVNLPHETLNHLTDLLPLMRKGTPSLIRGWAIIDRGAESSVQDDIESLLLKNGATNLELTCQEIKGFSATKIFVRIESWQTFV
tara:strand:- start:1155 stop:2285 length:1131 start_codon:yes stop_codon:yes gene_type:complete